MSGLTPLPLGPFQSPLHGDSHGVNEDPCGTGEQSGVPVLVSEEGETHMVVGLVRVSLSKSGKGRPTSLPWPLPHLCTLS